jgi:RNA polymerase sigma-70 factor (sigma-E family)
MARGDEDFAEFVQASSPGLLRAAYLLTGDRHVAEDAAQTALVRTYAAWSRVRRDDAFAYARRVLVNHVTDRWRRRLREYATGALPDQPARTDVAEEVATRQYLIGALASLTARERAVVVMRYFFDLPEATVAGELQITVGTVKSTSARALAKLRISPDPPARTTAAPAPAAQAPAAQVKAAQVKAAQMKAAQLPAAQLPPAAGPATVQASAMGRDQP